MSLNASNYFLVLSKLKYSIFPNECILWLHSSLCAKWWYLQHTNLIILIKLNVKSSKFVQVEHIWLKTSFSITKKMHVALPAKTSKIKLEWAIFSLGVRPTGQLGFKRRGILFIYASTFQSFDFVNYYKRKNDSEINFWGDFLQFFKVCWFLVWK